MTKRVLFVALVVIMAAGAFVAQPYITVYRYQAALKSGDVDRINEYIDYPALRHSLKTQIRLMFIKEMARDSKTAFGPLAMGFVGLFADKMIDVLITPEGMAAMFSGEFRALGEEINADHPSEETQHHAGGDLLSKCSFSYQFPSRFVISSKSDTTKGGEIKLIFRRNWLVWKLSAIQLPPLSHTASIKAQ
ncbi:MAG: DUF2939 domain-containing protein [Deltaproteobacteria bacterium]|nr:DUF2939 domain-containing protein [Deltaproteobacteria bacterium]MBW2309000.1 DUF2939 domain-containing protein [Deltaproteobacteria bacterium]